MSSFNPPSFALIPPERFGWLEKRGKVHKAFTKRYFVLRNNELKYYKSDKANETSQGKIVLDGCAVEIVPEGKYGRKYCFELTAPLQNRIFVIVAENGASLQEWMNAIRRAMLRLRRERSRSESAQRRKPRSSTEDSDSDTSPRFSGHHNKPVHFGTAPTHRDPIHLVAPQSAVANRTPIPSSVEIQNKSNLNSSNNSESSNNNISVSINTSDTSQSSPSQDAGNDADDKYSVYLQWLEETKDGQNRPRKAVAQREGDGSLLYQRLLDEEQEQKKGCCSKCIIS